MDCADTNKMKTALWGYIENSNFRTGENISLNEHKNDTNSLNDYD